MRNFLVEVEKAGLTYCVLLAVEGDFPAVWGSSISYEVDVIKHCKYLTDEEKEKILGVNAANLLNLKPKK